MAFLSWVQHRNKRIRCQWKAGDVKRSISIWGKKKWVDWEKSEYFENVEGNRLPRIFVSTVIPRRATDFDVDFNWITLWHYVAQAVLKVNFRRFLKYLCLVSILMIQIDNSSRTIPPRLLIQKTLNPEIFDPVKFDPINFSSKRHFIQWTFDPMDFWSNGLFIQWTFQPLYFSATTHLVLQ